MTSENRPGDKRFRINKACFSFIEAFGFKALSFDDAVCRKSDND